MDFPTVYWINLDGSRNNRRRMEAMFKELNITNHFRISGVNGWKGEYSSFVRFDNKHLTEPEKGCTASHLRAIDTALREGGSSFIVLEDVIDLRTFHKWYFLDDDQREDIQTAFGEMMRKLAPENVGYIHLSQPDNQIVKVVPYCFPNDGSKPRFSPICGSSTSMVYYRREYAQEIQRRYKREGVWDLTNIGKYAVADKFLNTYPKLLPLSFNLKRYCFPVFSTLKEDDMAANDILLKVLQDPSRSREFTYLSFIPSTTIVWSVVVSIGIIAMILFFVFRYNKIHTKII